MKLCLSCGQLLAEDISTCPACGNEVAEGRKSIDDYRIIEVLHEGYATILCRAGKDQVEESVMIRIFNPQSGVDERIAERLKNELEELKKLPEKYFVRHFEVRQSSDGLWYRVSEWLDTENWGNLIASGAFQDYRVAFQLFYRIASILEGLHRIGHFIPHLILDDILVIKGNKGELEIKIDYKLSRFFDPKLDRPGPTLQKLLSCHPDIINRRPLDFRSDIWSLGKIVVELLTAKHDSTDFQAEIDTLPLPPEIAVLLKTMLADDPNLRPQSMAEVAGSISRVEEEEIESAMRRRRDAMQAQAPVQEIRSLKKRIGQLVLIVGIVAILVMLAWFFFFFSQKDTEKMFGMHANRYAKSVAFVLAGLHPLPLDEKMEALTVPKLSPVIALGFPLGSRTQEATVNVSVTQGHVRRAFENLSQMDTSIHRGNSGGPVIDIRGKVIGIASGVAMDWIAGPVPVPTMLSDMGMVLPINKAVNFLQELKSGKVKWNGVLDLSA